MAAALRSAAVSAKNGAKTLLISSKALGNGGTSALEGLATPIHEMNNRGHREDTIKSGYFLCDQDIVTTKTNMAIDEMNHLEKAGVVFSRDAKGLPMTKKESAIRVLELLMLVMLQSEMFNKS